MQSAAEFERQVSDGARFQFGKNWRNYLSVLDAQRVEVAVDSMKGALGLDSLVGRSFLDVGSGSGLFSLSAVLMGAERVYSFDFDPQSVESTLRLKESYVSGDDRWTVSQGSVLDEEFLDSLGTFDIVYSWGVLHHTGDMWRALTNVEPLVAPGGTLLISIYNDQGQQSKFWRKIKRVYNRLPQRLKVPYVVLVSIPLELGSLVGHTLRGKPMGYIRKWSEYGKNRGMSRWHDLVDWIGGYPFEVAKPEQIFDFYRDKGYQLLNIKTCAGGLGCNEYVFSKAMGR